MNKGFLIQQWSKYNMAGDWLKVESCTPDKPEVWEIAELIGIDPDAVFGKCFRVWCWFDQHSEDGNASSVTKLLLDRKVGVTGFLDSMINVGWLYESDGQISMSNFDIHNGSSAKKRANTAKRVAKNRTKSTSNASSNADVTLDALPREEKRREENIKDIKKNIKKKTPTASDKSGKAKNKRFAKPSVQEIKQYCDERNNSVDPQAFVDHYESNGWKVGKNPMKSWKAAVRTWERNSFTSGGNGNSDNYSEARLP